MFITLHNYWKIMISAKKTMYEWDMALQTPLLLVLAI